MQVAPPVVAASVIPDRTVARIKMSVTRQSRPAPTVSPPPIHNEDEILLLANSLCLIYPDIGISISGITSGAKELSFLSNLTSVFGADYQLNEILAIV